jgi:hypothetical protein
VGSQKDRAQYEIKRYFNQDITQWQVPRSHSSFGIKPFMALLLRIRDPGALAWLANNFSSSHI